MRALITRQVSTNLESDCRALWGGPQDVDHILSVYAEAAVRSKSDEVVNVLFAPPAACYDHLALGPSVKFFEDAWGAAFLALCCGHLRDGGALELHKSICSGADGLWSLDALARFLLAERVVKGKASFTFEKPRPPAVPHSILDWFYRHAFRNLALMNMPVEGWAAPAASAMDYKPMAQQPAYDKAAQLLGPQKADEVVRFIKEQAYYVAGIAYKAALMKHIAARHVKVRSGMKMIDFGGGYGLLGAELLLDPELAMEKAVVQDLQDRNRVSALIMHAQIPALQGRFFFDIGAAQDFAFSEPFHLISFVGSLLYVPKAERAPLLDRCWDNLPSGGALVIHENIKHASYTRDFEFMFEVDELDELLGRYGAIERYESFSKKSVSKTDAAAKSVFRVVEKP